MQWYNTQTSVDRSMERRHEREVSRGWFQRGRFQRERASVCASEPSRSGQHRKDSHPIVQCLHLSLWLQCLSAPTQKRVIITVRATMTDNEEIIKRTTYGRRPLPLQSQRLCVLRTDVRAPLVPFPHSLWFPIRSVGCSSKNAIVFIEFRLVLIQLVHGVPNTCMMDAFKSSTLTGRLSSTSLETSLTTSSQTSYIVVLIQSNEFETAANNSNTPFSGRTGRVHTTFPFFAAAWATQLSRRRFNRLLVLASTICTANLQFRNKNRKTYAHQRCRQSSIARQVLHAWTTLCIIRWFSCHQDGRET